MSEELDLDAIEKAAKAMAFATPLDTYEDALLCREGQHIADLWGPEDARAVALMVNSVPALVAEVRKLREAWAAMNAAADKFCADWKAAEAEVKRLREEIARMRDRGAS